MGGHERRLRFGYFLRPEADAPLLDIARRADRYGLDLLGIQDHPYRPRSVDAHSLMAAVLGATKRIRVFPAVSCLPLRPPALLAKAMATLDLVSGGRVDLGLGAGASRDGIEAYGGPSLTAGEARTALEEAVLVIRSLWDGDRGVHFHGEHYRLAGAVPGPVPAHPVGVWLGVTGNRSLELAGRVADGWIASSASVPLGRLVEAQRRIDEAARYTGRDPAEIRRIYILDGSSGLVGGDTARWAGEIAELALGCGVDSFLFDGDPEYLETFALEIVPAVRATVVRERADASV
ncbi:LLM class flavin-dependent oxidoreductase [Actinomadura vinacea]|uniref:LLM class flavin-dependent oxidoreductase n=1 Tax=Actinomadura vinacea TaxID=115336 RepID=A0ABN3JNS1_9ACTN